MIDLRSDTVTVPDEGMRAAIMSAKVGDDVYGEDPTVNELQDKVAAMFGKEAALYVPSGTMSNQLAMKVISEPADEIIIESNAHVFYYETAAPSVISNVQFFTLPSVNGEISIDLIEQAVRPDVYYFPKTRAIFLENTHNRHGGTILSIDYLRKLKTFADKNNLLLHLDGARIWNAHCATDVPLSDYGTLFDTISVCLSKGLGAPVGSVLVADKEKISKALKWRKILGGGMRQAGILAAAGIYAIDNNLQLLKNDHVRTKIFAEAISVFDGISCDLDKVQTNMAVFKLDNDIKDSEFVQDCKNRGLLVSAVGTNKIRAVFHFQIDDLMTKKAISIINESINHLKEN